MFSKFLRKTLQITPENPRKTLHIKEHTRK